MKGGDQAEDEVQVAGLFDAGSAGEGVKARDVLCEVLCAVCNVLF
jgi:hypothetical protein